jgi:NAD(P)H-hydrate epimerase
VTFATFPRSQAPVVPSATLHEADARAKDELGIEPLQLMEIAGWQVARIVDALLGGAPGKRIRVVAGSGNNGGDALVAARFLHQRGALVRVSMVRLKDPASLSAHHANTINRLGMRIDQAPAGINGSADLIVDGLLGTGTRPPLREPAPAIISAMNAAGRPIVAVDVPSGMDADTGLGAEQAVRATATVTLAPRNWDSCRRRTAAASSWPILGCRRACFPQPVTRSNRSIGRRTWWS